MCYEKIKLSTKQLNLLKEKITDLSSAETENALGGHSFATTRKPCAGGQSCYGPCVNNSQINCDPVPAPTTSSSVPCQ